MKKREYKFVYTFGLVHGHNLQDILKSKTNTLKELEEELNVLAADGWRAVEFYRDVGCGETIVLMEREQ